ncbi:MAG TPA: prolyl oligopeptidase family serine peptidase, partial [Candidatus Manganitrophaceae bacterium]|nr:prolyl oligopeptidase family serine peptidase [Candidatus Manganitrophaceae bacterium]
MIRIWMVAVLLFSPSCAGLHEKAPQSQAVEEDDLNLLVQQFLASADPDQSDALLKEIKNKEGVSVEKLEGLIEKGRRYPPKPPVGQTRLSVALNPDHPPGDLSGREERNAAVYIPEKYDPASPYPLIVCLHGAGFTGDAYLDRWRPRLGETAILACPTMEDGAWWSPEGEALVLAVIDSVSSKYHVDPDRIYLTGMSNGGIGTYLIGAFHADRFAAIAPMAGGIPDEIFPFLNNLQSTGIYIIHGEKDQVMPVTLSRKISDYLKSQGVQYTYREHALEHPMAGGHFFPKEELPALIEWLQGRRRNPYPSRVVSVRDSEHLGPFYWTEINETSGEVADVLDSIFNRAEAERVRKG